MEGQIYDMKRNRKQIPNTQQKDSLILFCLVEKCD